jgi:hypothetical protein
MNHHVDAEPVIGVYPDEPCLTLLLGPRPTVLPRRRGS